MGGEATSNTVTVNADRAPVLAKTAEVSSLNENSAISTVLVNVNDGVDDFDADGDDIQYSLTNGDSSYFNVDNDTGALTFKALPDFETKSSYSVTITGTATGGSDSI